MKLARLQPRIATLNTSIGSPLVVERIRGRARVERNRRFLAAHPWCEHCREQRATEADHRVALHLGGADDESNLQALCHGCHVTKTSAEHAARAGR